MSQEATVNNTDIGNFIDEPCRYIEVSAPETDTDGHTIIPVAKFAFLNKQIAYIDKCLALLGACKLAPFIAVIDNRLQVPIVCDPDLFQRGWPTRREVARIISGVEDTANIMSTRLRENQPVDDDEVREVASILPVSVKPELLKDLAIDATALDWNTATGALLLPKLDGSHSPLALPAKENLRPAREPSIQSEDYHGIVIAHFDHIGLLLFADGTIGKVVAGQDVESIRPGQKIHGPILDKRGTMTFRIFAGPIQSSPEKPLFTAASKEAVSVKSASMSNHVKVAGNSSPRTKSKATAIAKYKSRGPQRGAPKKN